MYYSNLTDLCEDLRRATEQLRIEFDHDATGTPRRVSVRSVQPKPQTKRIADRLSEGQIHKLIDSFQQDTPAHILAKRYGVSLTAIKALLKKRGIHSRRKIADRLSQAEVDDLLVALRDGASQSKLAAKYGMSLTSVKKLIRNHGAQQYSNGDTAH